MNAQTLRKLKNNPFYKLNKEQQAELDGVDRIPMITFGRPEFNDNTVRVHPTITKENERRIK